MPYFCALLVARKQLQPQCGAPRLVIHSFIMTTISTPSERLLMERLANCLVARQRGGVKAIIVIIETLKYFQLDYHNPTKNRNQIYPFDTKL